MLVLEQEAGLNDSCYRIINLARSLPSVGADVTTMGWGWTEHGRRSNAEVLQYLDLPIADNSDCNAAPDKLGIKPHELCCGKNQSEYTNICHQDSGSPLVYPGYSTDDSQVEQIGITARGHQGCLAHYNYGAFVSVSYSDVFTWISCVTDYLSKNNPVIFVHFLLSLLLFLE